MIAIYYLLAYEGGAVEPGDDMLGSQYRWWSLMELEAEQVKVVVSVARMVQLRTSIWLLEMRKP